MVEVLVALAMGLVVSRLNAPIGGVFIAALGCAILYFINNRYLLGAPANRSMACPRPTKAISRSFLLSYAIVVYVLACCCVGFSYGLVRLISAS